LFFASESEAESESESESLSEEAALAALAGDNTLFFEVAGACGSWLDID
jgi:hypothetical protein